MAEEKDKAPRVVIFEGGKPVATNNPQDARQLELRIRAIDTALKEMGYKDGYQKYSEYVGEMAKSDFPKYLKFLDRVNELAKAYASGTMRKE